MWAFGVVSTINNELLPSKNEIVINENSPQEFKHFITTEISENDLVITELEPEFEVELEWCNFHSTIYFRSDSNPENTNRLFYTYHFYLTKSRPLYDLFCNWKFHLS